MPKGLYFKKVDLHVHTPASNCFGDKTITPEDIVESALSKGLDAIAITDHNTGEWIDKVKEIAKDNNLTVFPGVEITVSEGFHILAIFDIDKGTEDINNFLGFLNIDATEYAKSDTICKSGSHEIIEKIVERGGIAILAHIDNIKGAYRELSGISRIKLFNEANYSAVEITSEELPEDLNNRDVFKKPITYYQASDNPDPTNNKKHSTQGIGNKYSYFKMSSIDLEGLRQCFNDPDVRIRNMTELIESKYPKILNIKASEGFLKYQNIKFHPGLNSIIGGKGVGKSLIVELLRFGLGQPSKDEKILNDHNGKLEKRLGSGNYVEIDIMLESGAKYKITRFVDGEHTCIDLSKNEDYRGSISELFPILAYSQTEVIKIAENEDAQLELIDSFINKNYYTKNILDQKNKIKDNDDKLAQSINSKFELASVEKDLKTIEVQIEEIDKSLNNDTEEDNVLKEYRLLDQKNTNIKSKLDNINIFEEMIQNLNSEISKLEINLTHDTLKEDSDLKMIDDKYEHLKKDISQNLQAISKDIKDTEKTISETISSFLKEYDEKKEEYNLIFSQTEKKKELKKDRDRLVKQFNELEKTYYELDKQASNFEEIRSKRNELLDELDELYLEYFNARSNIYEKLTDLSDNKLRLELFHSKNISSFNSALTELLRGSNTRGTIVSSICENMLPRNFVEVIIEKDTKKLEDLADIDENNAEKIMNKLWSGGSLTPILSLQHECYPEDVPSIQFKKPDGKYSPLKELSVGQKCTALLIIALSEGSRPVLIDQPEDALDITTVWEDVSTSLRGNKDRRQFILTTHNSSVAVASDSDNFIIVNSNSSIANVKSKGSIDNNDVKTDVIKCLEGGEIPYLLRGNKYNII